MLYLLYILSLIYYASIIFEMHNGTMRCHKKSERCPSVINDKSWRICTRCLSMYFFMGLFPLYYLVITKYISLNLNLLLCIGLLSMVMQVPMLIDGITQRKKKRTSNNYLRFITGGISGVGLGLVVTLFTIIIKGVI